MSRFCSDSWGSGFSSSKVLSSDKLVQNCLLALGDLQAIGQNMNRPIKHGRCAEPCSFDKIYTWDGSSFAKTNLVLENWFRICFSCSAERHFVGWFLSIVAHIQGGLFRACLTCPRHLAEVRLLCGAVQLNETDTCGTVCTLASHPGSDIGEFCQAPSSQNTPQEQRDILWNARTCSIFWSCFLRLTRSV